MKYEDRQELKRLSLLAFGRTGRYKTIMRRGRKEFNTDGSFKHTVPITVQEITDTMNYILEQREANQQRILEELNGRSINEGTSETARQDGGTETVRESPEVSESSDKA